MSHFETEYDKNSRNLPSDEEPGLPATHKAVLHVLLSKSQDVTKAVEHAQKAVNRYRWIIQDSKGAFTSSDHKRDSGWTVSRIRRQTPMAVKMTPAKKMKTAKKTATAKKKTAAKKT
ncbi:hypothetical protein CGCTS75_v007277 [Colletotrichum tropicale]|nr:hypothetical protein CGCTS75_v007277 [Colletotrichum tropicale]